MCHSVPPKCYARRPRHASFRPANTEVDVPPPGIAGLVNLFIPRGVSASALPLPAGHADPPRRQRNAPHVHAMYLLIIAVSLLMLKIYEIQPVDSWSWAYVLLPSLLTLLWKLWADWSGYTRQRIRARRARKKSARYVRDKDLFKFNPTKSGDR